MSYIDVINQGATASIQAKSTDAEKDTNVMGKEDFLTLLVTQLQNQDPLNPDEPTEFTAQLAQFSSLEQLFNLNESMETMAQSVTDSQKMSALNMMGKDVAYADSAFAFSGEPVSIGYSIDGDAKDITLLLQKDGATVATLHGIELTEGDHFLVWDGTTPSGIQAPHGEYSIVVQASAAVDSIAAAPLVRSEVTGVDLESGNGGLLYTRAGSVDVNKIRGVYEIEAKIDEEASSEQLSDIESASEITDGVEPETTEGADELST